jgi:hypothetical protein
MPVTSWICKPPTLPTYTRCTGHAPVDLEQFWFTTGCYDSTTGRPVNCAEAWSETVSTEGVDPVWLDYWTGGHTHSRYEGDALKNLGGFWLDILPGGIQTVLDSGEFQTRHPADTTCRTCWGAFTVAAHVEGLELLPDSDFYIKHSNPGDHVDDDQLDAIAAGLGLRD